MPEGPSLLILKESAEIFKGKEIIHVGGNTKTDKERLMHKTVMDIRTWGKHFLLCFEDFTLKIHLMMFGSCLVNDSKNVPARLHLKFADGEINFYNCSVKFLEGWVDTLYDFSSDVLSDEWNAQKAKEKLSQIPDEKVCDALLEQDIFSGVGNIIKNEVLFRIRVHPDTLLGNLPDEKTNELIAEARNYSFDFLRWKKQYELAKHWLVYHKGSCSVCEQKIRRRYTGKKNRVSYFCENCQTLYDEVYK